MEVTGRVTGRGTGTGVDGVVVELLDRALLWPNPVATSAETSASGEFSITFPRVLDPLPLPTLRATQRGVAVASMDADPAWSGGTFPDVSVVLAPPQQLPSTYRLDGQALDRRTRLGVAGLRVEVWASGFGSMLGAGITDPEGRFAVAFAAGCATEDAEGRRSVYRAARSSCPRPTTSMFAWSALGEAMTFVEVDADGVAPRSFVVSGRVLDTASHAGLPGLRVEAWDRLPRDGGNIGVAADTSGDGSFQLSVPAPTPVAERLLRRPDLGRPLAPFPYAGPTLERLAGPTGSTGSTMPSLIFRIYSDDRLVATLSPDAHLDAERDGRRRARDRRAVGRTVDRGRAPRARREPGHHRRPGPARAVPLPELDGRVRARRDRPGVSRSTCRVDQLGQVRTTVLDSSTATDRAGRSGPHAGEAPCSAPHHGRSTCPTSRSSSWRSCRKTRAGSWPACGSTRWRTLCGPRRAAVVAAALVALELDVDLDVLLAEVGSAGAADPSPGRCGRRSSAWDSRTSKPSSTSPLTRTWPRS